MGVPLISDDVTSFKSSYTKCLTVVAITAILMVSTSSGQRNTRVPLQSTQFLTLPSTESDVLYRQIRQRVTDLEYPEAVAEDFALMVSNWKTPRGRSVLPVLQKILVRAREAYQKGLISKIQLAETEEKVVAGLCQSIKSKIAYRRDYFDLTRIIETRQANCFGYTQLFCILGNSIGLSVSAMNVTTEHVANIVGLSDGTMTVVDLIRASGFLSERIITDSEFEGDGSHWRYKDKNHITRENKTIHILDRNELIGEIHFCRGTMQYMSGQGAEAIAHYDRAIELSPQCARAYNNRGGARLILSDHTEAISDFNKAIDLAPTYVSAYHNRANAYLDSEQYSRAISDYTEAIELNPQFAKAYFGRGFAHLALDHYDEAISDYTQAIKLNPSYARAYYTRAIGYAHLEEREKAVQDMLQAVALDQTLRADVQKVSAEFDLNLKPN
ncbi:tetratricopeptide repeat protein [Planctomycetota bacterium]